MKSLNIWALLSLTLWAEILHKRTPQQGDFNLNSNIALK